MQCYGISSDAMDIARYTDNKFLSQPTFSEKLVLAKSHVDASLAARVAAKIASQSASARPAATQASSAHADNQPSTSQVPTCPTIVVSAQAVHSGMSP